MVDTPDHPTLGRVGGGLEPWEFLARDERRPGRDTITKGKGRANMSNGVDGEEACDVRPRPPDDDVPGLDQGVAAEYLYITPTP